MKEADASSEMYSLTVLLVSPFQWEVPGSRAGAGDDSRRQHRRLGADGRRRPVKRLGAQASPSCLRRLSHLRQAHLRPVRESLRTT